MLLDLTNFTVQVQRNKACHALEWMKTIKAREILSRKVFNVVDVDAFHSIDNSEDDGMILDGEARSATDHRWSSHTPYKELPKVVL